MVDLERKTLEDTGRVYYDADVAKSQRVYLPSVTTIFDVQPEPYGLKMWKKKYDGKNGMPYWKDIRDYKGARGTLIHYEITREFANEDMFGQNEIDALEYLEDNNKHHEYAKELRYAMNAWADVRDSLNIKKFLDVECYVKNMQIGYAGQFDLLYLDSSGDVVLADLKTSKAVYDKYKIQLTAYKHAINLDIDRLEVIRIHPDSKTWEVSTNEEWQETDAELFGEFVSLREELASDLDHNLDHIAQEGIDDG